MASESSRDAFPWGSVSFALGLAAVFGYYAQNVYAEARGATDWMLIVPAAGIGIAALLIIAGTKAIDWGRRRQASSASPPIDASDRETDTTKTVAANQDTPRLALLFMGLLTLYVVLIPSIGFDLGSLIFVFLSLYLQGERRLWLLAGFSVAVSSIVVLIFIVVLGIRLPTLLI